MWKLMIIAIMLGGCGTDKKSDNSKQNVSPTPSSSPTPSPKPDPAPVPLKIKCMGWPSTVKSLTDKESQIKKTLGTVQVGDTLKTVLPEAKDILLGNQVEVKTPMGPLGCDDFKQYHYDTYFGTGEGKFTYDFQFCDGKIIGILYCDPSNYPDGKSLPQESE